MRWLSVLLTASSALVLVACGGTREESPKIERPTASRLAAEADAIADLAEGGDLCGAAHRADRLNADVETAVADGDVPPRLAAELQRSSQALVDELNCPAPPPPPEEDEDNGKGKKKGKKKHGGEGE